MILNKSSVDRGMCHGQIYQVFLLLPFVAMKFSFLIYLSTSEEIIDNQNILQKASW